MEKKHDWMDYTNLAANLATTANLERLRSEQKEANRILTEAAESIAEGEETRLNERKLQKTLRNAIWRGFKILEEVESAFANEPLQLAVQMHLITPDFSADMCDEWEDKKKLDALFKALDAKKQELRQKIGEIKYNQTVKCSSALRELEWVSRFIIFEKLESEYLEKRTAWQDELDTLKLQFPSDWKCFFSSKQRLLRTELLAKIERKLIEEPDSDWLEQLLPNAKKDDDTQHLSDELEELEERWLERQQELEEAGEDLAAEEYREKLLQEVKLCLELETVESAEAVAKKLL